MTALYIILGILLFLFLICLIRVQVFLLYTQDVHLTLKVLFYKKALVPSEKKDGHKKKKEKKEKKQEPEEPKEKKKDKKEKKPGYLGRLKAKKGLSGIVSLFVEIAKLAGGLLKGLFSHIVIKRLNVGIALNSGDAASTAIMYGKLCSAVYPAVNVITAVTVCKDYQVTLEPIFDDDRDTEIYADVHAYIRVGWALWEALKAGVKLLIFRIRM